MIIESEEAKSRPISRLWLVPVFLLPMVLVLVLSSWLRIHDHEHDMTDFAERVDNRISDITRTTQVVLSTLAGYYQMAEFVDASSLTTLSQTLLGQNPFIHSIRHQSWVPVERRERFEDEIRQQGMPHFRVRAADGLLPIATPLEGRSGYLPVTFVEPLTPENAPLLGRDMFSLVEDDRVIRRAVESAGPVAMDPVEGLKLPRHSLLWIHATYDGHKVPESTADRYRKFNGLFLIAVDLHRLMGQWLSRSDGYEAALIEAPGQDMAQDAWKLSDTLYLHRGSTLSSPVVICHHTALSSGNSIEISRPIRLEELWSWGGLLLALLAGLLASVFFLLWRSQYHQRRIAELARSDLDRERARAHKTLHAIGDAVLVVDSDWYIHYINPAAEKMLQVSWPDEKGSLLDEIVHLRDAETDEPLEEIHAYFLEQSQEGEGPQVCLLKPDGGKAAIDSRVTLLSFPDGNEGMVIVIRDVSTERELTDRLAYQATHDMLTRLYNRAAFESRICELLEESAAAGTRHAIIYLGLDRFKLVNDTCGHAAGDELLKLVAGQIQGVLRGDDLLARTGGDEFGVLLRECELDVAENVAHRILVAIENFRFRREDKVFQIHASIGVVPLDRDQGVLRDVLMAADLACHVAKEQGCGRIYVHGREDTSIEKRHQEMQWLPRLQEALDSDRFELFLQPIFPVRDEAGLPVMNEFLIRLRGEDGRMLSPGLFIPSAERYGLMWQIDRWMVENAIAYLKEVEEGWETLYTINLSAQTFGDRAFAEFVEMTLESYGVDAGMVCFELTETAAITNIANASDLMMALRELGCSILLDDFGSGLSSFGYLKNLPIDYLKIDGQFVRDITTDPLDEVMVRMCQELANVLGVKTVAEFIENQEILEAVKAIGVDYAQGYHLGRPQPAMQLVGRRAAAG